MRTILQITSALRLFRLDDGRAARLSPTAPVKLVIALACILLVSLSRNALFVLVVLALVLVRACLMPREALGRLASASLTAAGLALLIMAPAALLGQPQSALTLALKALACTGVTLTLALTTPTAELTGALRSCGVPAVAILTVDLTLRSIVRLGETALEVLSALRLRSVGTNHDKRGSLAGVGGVVLLKAGRAAQDTYDAMRCRGFDGRYEHVGGTAWRPIDALWLTGLAALVVLFVYLQGVVS